MRARTFATILSLSFGLLSACGGKVVLDYPGAGGGGSGGDGGGPSVSSSVGTGVPGCSAASDCEQCCVEAVPNGNESLMKYYVSACVCEPGAPCGMACANTMICQDPFATPLEAPCAGCMDNVGMTDAPCIDATLVKCSADAACAAVLQCVQNC